MLKRREYSPSASCSPQLQKQTYRVGSARSGEGAKKTTRARPSSAPVTKFNVLTSQPLTKAKKSKSSDNTIAQLKVEGKAIRSQGLIRRQPINRGLMKVYSSHKHQFNIPFRRMSAFQKYKYARSESENGSRLDFYSSKRHFSDDNSVREEPLIHNNSVTNKLQLNNFFNANLTLDYNDSNDSFSEESIPFSHESKSVSPTSNFYLSENDEDDLELRPSICLVSKTTRNSKLNVRKGLQRAQPLFRSSETDSVSNDEGSESTILSLGQKIQRMASENVTQDQPIPVALNNNETIDGNAWKEILQHNHLLLLNESKDNLGLVEENYPNLTKYGSNKLNATEDNSQIIDLECQEPIQNYCISKMFPTEKKFRFNLDNIIEIDDNTEDDLKVIEEVKNNTIQKTTIESENSPESLACDFNFVKGSETDEQEPSIKELQKEKNSKESVPQINHIANETEEEVCKNKALKEMGTQNINTKIDDSTDNVVFNGTTYKALHKRNVLRPYCTDIKEALEMIEVHQSRDKLMPRTTNEDEKEEKIKELDNDTEVHRTTEKESLLQTLKYLKAENCDIQEVAGDVDVETLVQKILLFAKDLEKIVEKGNSLAEKIQLEDLVEAERILERACIKEGAKEETKKGLDLHLECQQQLTKLQKELEERIHKNLELIRKLLDDKKALTEKCEGLAQELTKKDLCHLDKMKVVKEQHSLEIKSLREKLTAADQRKREQWTQHKTKLIKDSTYRSLETKVKDLTTHHREELSQQKEVHWKELREKEEMWLKKTRDLEEQIKNKYEKEKEEECKREREREEERFQNELRQSELVWQARLDSLQKQNSLNTIELEEQMQRQIHRLNQDHDAEMRNLKKALESLRDDYEEKLRNESRNHQAEIMSQRQSNDKAQAEWREQIVKEYEESKHKFEKELRDRLRRQRDKEIEKAISEIQQETSVQLENQQRSYDSKIKNLRERYETELRDLEDFERISRTKYLEMKGALAQREEEIVYLRARMHTQSLEISDFQQMFSSSG